MGTAHVLYTPIYCLFLHTSIPRSARPLISRTASVYPISCFLVVQSFATFALSTLLAYLFHCQSATPISRRDTDTATQPAERMVTFNFTPLLAGMSSAIAAFSSCIFTTSTTQTSKKNPEQSLAQLQRFLVSKVVKSSIPKLGEGCLRPQQQQQQPACIYQQKKQPHLSIS